MNDEKPSVKKFSVPEMVSNDNGKTSGSGTMGSLCMIIGCMGFMYGTYDYSKGTGTNEIISQSMMLIMVGAGLLGIRKVGGSFGKVESILPQDSSKSKPADVPNAADASEEDSVDRV